MHGTASPWFVAEAVSEEGVFWFSLHSQHRVGWQEQLLLPLSSSCGPPKGGRGGCILGMPVLGLEMLAELQQAPQAAKAPWRREVPSPGAGKWSGVFFRDQLDTGWCFLIREINYCTEKAVSFLASYNDVARLPSVFCSAVIFDTILLKSCGS